MDVILECILRRPILVRQEWSGLCDTAMEKAVLNCHHYLLREYCRIQQGHSLHANLVNDVDSSKGIVMRERVVSHRPWVDRLLSVGFFDLAQ